MGKVFRIFKEGATTYSDWHASPDFPYDSAARDTIADPEGATASKEITSIPSPLARIDLVASAFARICRAEADAPGSALSGDTIYHKLVSETLDVGEVFFNMSRLAEDVEIIKWNPAECLPSLEKSESDGNKLMGEALAKYLKSDSSAYNFSLLHNIYLLNYRRGPQMLNIIGATSPATVFFSCAGDFSYVGQRVDFGLHKPFGVEFAPLYMRDPDYIKAWFALRKSIPGFATLFPVVDEYLRLTYAAVPDDSLKNELLSVSAEDADIFAEIKAGDSDADSVEVLGYKLLGSRPHAASGSEFEVAATRGGGERPLVLPVTAGNRYESLIYTSARWGSENAAPLSDSRPLAERTLPRDGRKQPYITLGDFLEDSIIAVPHAINSGDFFDAKTAEGVSKREEHISYLLPVKPLYFEYFSPDDLCAHMHDGKRALEIQPEAGGAKVWLRIPIRGRGDVDYMEYSRTYYEDGAAGSHVTVAGRVVHADFTALLMPCVEWRSDEEARYTAAVVSTESRPFALEFYIGGRAISGVRCSTRNTPDELTRATAYTLEHKRFEYMRLSVGNDHALILPLLREAGGPARFRFAVDLGTSFTHIEYTTDGSPAEAFGYGGKDSLLSELFVPEYVRGEAGLTQWDLLDEQPLIEKDFLPLCLGRGRQDSWGRGVDFGFPVQTVLSCARTLKWEEGASAFADVNIPFAYGKRRDLPHNRYEFNIKWGDERQRASLAWYIDCLMVMMRCKVALSGGDLAQTEIVWFYPQSMPQGKLTALRRIWDDAYNKYFRPAPATTESMPESVAPMRYYSARIASSSEIMNIDIGGGTTDVAFAAGGEIKWTTSFRFAMNNLFSDAIAPDNLSNGIIDYFRPRIRRVLEAGGMSELLAVMDGESMRRPENMAAFLFSLRDSRSLRAIDTRLVDFDYILETDEKFKIVFLLFYTSIIYHLAGILRLLGCGIPRHVAFSGNGSYVARILSSSEESVAKYTRAVLAAAMNADAGGPLEIAKLAYGDTPKTVTCKGGLSSGSDDAGRAYPRPVVMRADQSTLCAGETYSAVDEERRRGVADAAKRFFDFALHDIPRRVDVLDLFGVTSESISLAAGICLRDLDTFTEKLLARAAAGQGAAAIEETAFFYPIAGALGALSREIYERNK